MEVLDILDYYHPPSHYRKLLKKFTNYIRDGDAEAADAVRIEMAETIGIVYTSKSKKIGKVEVAIPVTEFREVDFVEFLHQSFTAICVGENVAMYNFNAHRYEFVLESVYLSFFKQILDEIDTSVWNTKDEKSVSVRFIRDIQTRFNGWEIPPGKVVFNNGVLDVLTMQFEEGTHPEVYNFHCTGYDLPIDIETYNCPEFEKYLWSVFEDRLLIEQAQEQYGYTFLYGMNPSEQLFVWEGGGRNGKSVGQEVLRWLHGKSNCGAASLAQINSRFGAAAIYNKVLNICSESDETVVETGLLKSITGNDMVYIDLKGLAGFEGHIAAKILYSCNSCYFNDKSRGFAERLLCLPYRFTFTDNPRPGTNERQKQVDILKKLEPEIPQIALWALAGLRRLMQNNWRFTKSPKSEALKQKILRDSNPVLQFFDECCSKSLGNNVKKSEAYTAFKTFTSERGISVVGIVSANKFHQSFGAILEEKGLTSVPKRINGNDCYSDISIIL